MRQEQIKILNPPIRLPIANSIKNLFKKLNFEFMDLENMPGSLRYVLRDVLEVGCNAPFRKYYQWTTSAVYEYAKIKDIKEIVELGAGSAPITRHLIKNYPSWDVTFKITDLNPDVICFKDLEQSDQRVKAVLEPLDFTKKIKGYENSLLVLSAAFHHVPEKDKAMILSSLKALSPHVMIFEPLRPTLPSLLLSIGGLTTGFLTPLFKMNSTFFLRNFLWCWLLPVAPFMFIWDGWVSAIRCWSKQKWHTYEPKAEIKESIFCTSVILYR